MMEHIFIKLLNMSITASWLILAVLCVRLLFRKMPKGINCLLWGEVAVKERVKSILNYKNPALWITILAMVVCFIVSLCFLANPSTDYRIRVTIPAGSTADFYYSDEEIGSKGNTVTIAHGEGLGDTEVVLLPVESKEENEYEPTYMTPGMPVKMDVEKGAWFKVGVYMENPTKEDIDVYVRVHNVEVRIPSEEN